MAGFRGRSPFVRAAIEPALRQERRWEHRAAAAGSIADTGHEWVSDPAAWVRAQRTSDPSRGG